MEVQKWLWGWQQLLWPRHVHWSVCRWGPIFQKHHASASYSLIVPKVVLFFRKYADKCDDKIHTLVYVSILSISNCCILDSTVWLVGKSWFLNNNFWVCGKGWYSLNRECSGAPAILQAFLNCSSAKYLRHISWTVYVLQWNKECTAHVCSPYGVVWLKVVFYIYCVSLAIMVWNELWENLSWM